MLDLDQLRLLGQLIDNIGVMTDKLEKSFAANNAEEFTKAKNGILETQNKITDMIYQEQPKPAK